MPDQPNQPPNPANEPAPPNERFKAEMPHIPGVSGEVPKPPGGIGGRWLVVAGLVAVLIAVFIGGKLLSKTRRSDSLPAPVAQIDLPSPAPDAAVSVPTADRDPVIALTSELKPWGAKQFNFHNPLTGENVAALLIRLPTGSSGQASGYWSVAMKPAYGSCQLEYVDDLDKLRTDYGYQQARHPMVGNPCSRSLYDPLKYATLPGNVLARGAVVQGSDLRPPLSIEVKTRAKQVFAVRME